MADTEIFLLHWHARSVPHIHFPHHLIKCSKYTEWAKSTQGPCCEPLWVERERERENISLKVQCYLYQFKGQTSGTLRQAAVWFIFISEPHQTLRPSIYCQTPQGHQNVNNWLPNKTPHFPLKYHHICHFKSIAVASHLRTG